jgi:hypothetical protein
VAGFCEYGNEPSRSLDGKFIGKLSDYQHLKKESAPWN